MKNHGAALCVASLLILSISCALADDPFCKEIDNADVWGWNPDCRRRNTLKSCSQGHGVKYSHYGSDVSCVWHHLEPEKLTEIINITNIGWGFTVPVDYYQNLSYRGTFCSLRVTASLDEASAKGMLGMYLVLFGGPLGTSLGFKLGQIDPEIQPSRYNQNYPVRPASSSGCTVGLGGPNTCSAELVAPHGYALDPRFTFNMLKADFFTKTYVKTWVPYNDSKGNEIPFRVKLKHEWARCKATNKPGWPKEIMSSDSVLFGSTPFNRAQQIYMFDEISIFADYYYTVSYRVYDVSFVSGVDWKVSVSRPQGKKTPLTVFLFERGSNKVEVNCNDTPEKCNLRMPLLWRMQITDNQVFGDCPKHKNCLPPKRIAIKGTLCKGTRCSGKARGLNPSKLYSLFVSYPRFDDPFAFARVIPDEEVGEAPPPKPVKSPYTTQLVNVKLVPKYWKLGKVQTA